jgi:hypothetical protein
MGEEVGVILVALALIGVCSSVSFFAKRQLEKLFPRVREELKFFSSALLPTLITVMTLLIWDHYDYQQYLKGPQEGRMGPLLFLIYGFPWFIINLVCNFSAVIHATRQSE